jgi:uncharacterized protein (DUF433 family)
MSTSLPEMSGKARGIRIPEELEQEIGRLGQERGQSWSAAAAELLHEAVRMRRAPGIVFADGPAGRRAVVVGTGLDVWEVVATWKSVGESFKKLKKNYDWLSEPQLRAALGYYELYPDEIDDRLEREAGWTPERVRLELPFATPRGGRS